MRTRTPLTLLAVALAAASALAQVADVKLPFNPIDGASAGDWAVYRITDPTLPGQTVAREIFAAQEVKDGKLVVTASNGDAFRYTPGDEGASALAFARGFFGVAREDKTQELKNLATAQEAIDLDGKHYDTTRIEGLLLTKFTDEDSGGRGAGEIKTTFRVWLTRGLHPTGMVKSECRVEMLGTSRGGGLELEQSGKKDEKPAPPKPREKKTAPPTPEGPTGTAAPK